MTVWLCMYLPQPLSLRSTNAQVLASFCAFFLSGYAAYDAGNYSPRLLKFSDVQEVKILLMLFHTL